MAGVFHISEEEAARDFGALLKRVRAGEEAVVDCDGGLEAVVKMVGPSEHAKSMNISDIIERLRKREERQGLAKLDADFEADVEEARRIYNKPLDGSQWD